MSGIPSIAAYETLRVLGEGGMGTVYLARDPVIGRMVAIKWLRAGTDGAGLRARLGQEARAAGRLNHPNIVTIFHVGEEGGRPCIVMEYVEGQSLAALIRDAITLPLVRTLSILEGVCAGLACAHGAGLIHRDIKPANIILDPTWEPKIVDFGLARVPDASVALTHEHAVLGTLSYMSPEQLSGGLVDHRSDLFALAAVAYELTTLRRAFSGSTQAVIAQILNGSAGDLIDDATMPADLAAIIVRGMDRDPAQRFQSAAEMGLEFGRLRQQLAADATSHRSRPYPPSVRPAREAVVDDSGTRVETPAVVRRPGQRLIWRAASVVIAVIALAVVYPRTGGNDQADVMLPLLPVEDTAPRAPIRVPPPVDTRTQETPRERPEVAAATPVPGLAPGIAGPTPSYTPPPPTEPEIIPVSERLPVGTTLLVSIVTSLDSRRHSSGDTFDGRLDAPVTVDGKAVVLSGARINGRVERSGVAVGGRPYLELSLTGVEIGKHMVPIRTGLYRAIAPAATRGVNVVAILIGGAAGATVGGIVGGGEGALAGAAIGVASTAVAVAPASEYHMGGGLPFRLAEAILLDGMP